MALFVFSADDSRKLVTAWTKYFSATERSSLVNMITRQMTSFFSFLTIWILSVGTFHFCILRPSKFSSMRSPLCSMFWSVKSTVLHAKDDNFKPFMGAQTRNLCYAKQILDIKGMVGAGWKGWVNPLIKVTFMKKSCFRVCFMKLWNMHLLM